MIDINQELDNLDFELSVDSYGEHLFPVRVFSPNGKLKKTISSKTLRARIRGQALEQERLISGSRRSSVSKALGSST